MSKNLVIVESPSKSKTIGKYLGDEYIVLSSVGHIRDLAKTGKYRLGVDIEHNFKPSYVNIKNKIKTVNELKKVAKTCDNVFLATDPDREGESISWHLADVLKLDVNELNRVEFHEITKNAIIDAFKHPRKIDMDLVKSQETRRILDRIIGFRLSKLLQAKLKSKSAGRVQSVALKLIVDREKEILAFNPVEYWSIKGLFNGFEADLRKFENNKIEINNEEQADAILNALTKEYVVKNIEKKTRSRKSKPAFITSTLQQEASTKLNFPSKKTMRVAQTLYEGIDIGNETVGLITYMRTDSTRLSDVFVTQAQEYIKTSFGEEYIGKVQFKVNENSQDAHEAIRPTSITRTPEEMKKYLKRDELRLYTLIYNRALASLMVDAKYDATAYDIENNGYQFRATGQILVFDGFLKVYEDNDDTKDGKDKILPILHENDVIKCLEINKYQHFTEPPARYTEARLIKEMEELGIGRPSTYAQTMETIQERGYVVLEDKKFTPTEQGVLTTDKLQEFFDKIINVEYTSNMEDSLDQIANGVKINYEVLKDFYDFFEPMVDNAYQDMEKIQPKETGELCPECGNPLVIRRSRYGEFTACSNYPNCKYIKPKEETKDEVESKEICDCPKCSGKIVEKKSRRNKIFFGCNQYPKCDFALWYKPTGEKCPKCNSLIVQKGKKIICSNCDYIQEEE